MILSKKKTFPQIYTNTNIMVEGAVVSVWFYYDKDIFYVFNWMLQWIFVCVGMFYTCWYEVEIKIEDCENMHTLNVYLRKGISSVVIIVSIVLVFISLCAQCVTFYHSPFWFSCQHFWEFNAIKYLHTYAYMSW